MNKRLRAIAVCFSLFTLIGVLDMSISSFAAGDDGGVSFDISHHHVGISVPDAEESAAWYKKMLGFEVVLRMNEDAVNKMKIVHIKRGSCYIELFQVEGAKPLPEHRRDPNMDLRVHGLAHMAFQVSDVHAAVKELKAKGAEIAMGPVDTPGIAFVFIRDNAGNAFELIQYK
ncbi:MAG: VOC family protein [Acidobacteria bacterium]|nr:VOC family protein [Acidobacteriota bacterium]